MRFHIPKNAPYISAAILAVTLGGCSLAFAAEGDAAAGAEKSMYCAFCHGVDGNSTVAGMPRLAGMSPELFIAKVQNYRKGPKLYHPVMDFLTLGLTHQDERDLAAYYASQPVTQSLPYNGPPPLK